MDTGDRPSSDDDDTVDETVRSREGSAGKERDGEESKGRDDDESKGEGLDDGQGHGIDQYPSQEVNSGFTKDEPSDESIPHAQNGGTGPDETRDRSGLTDEDVVSDRTNELQDGRGAPSTQKDDRAGSVKAETEIREGENKEGKGRESETRKVGKRDADRKHEASDGPEPKSLIRRFRHDNEGPLMWVREMLSSALIVLVLGLLLFAVSGVWPPMVAVESGSMEPNMDVGDLVFVTEPGRFAPDAAENDIGVVTYEAGQETDYRTFDSYGSVIIFQPPGRTASPIIHRAMFHVEEGEDWYDRADDRFHAADDCEQLRNCPAPHDGFVTRGDNNGQYDQVSGLAEPIKAEWVTGVARLRVPYLGYVRLIATGQAEIADVFSMTLPIEPAHAAEKEHESEYRSDLVRPIGYERRGLAGYGMTGGDRDGMTGGDRDGTTGSVGDSVVGSDRMAATTRSARMTSTTECDMHAPSASS